MWKNVTKDILQVFLQKFINISVTQVEEEWLELLELNN